MPGPYDEDMQERAARGDAETQQRLAENRAFRFPGNPNPTGPYEDDFMDLPDETES